MSQYETRILIVDDNVDSQFVLNTMLGSFGFPECLTANSAQEAYALLGLSETNSQTPPIDLILMDLNMPNINGLEACRTIRASKKLQEIPIIFITAMNGQEFRKEAFDAGAVDYLQRPVDPMELESRVRSVLKL